MSKSINISNIIVKLKEERQLLARFLIIQQARPQLVIKLQNTIANYEMALVPRSMFASDGSLLLTADKSLLLQVIESIPAKLTTVGRFAW